MKKTQKNKKQKTKDKRQFWGGGHLGKVKTKFSTSSILKKNFNKDNLKKNVEKYCIKTKSMWEKYCSNL
jgi:hypothetical protein